MIIGFANRALAHLLEAAPSSATIMYVLASDAQAFTAVYGDYIYALMRGSVDREIIRIDVTASKLNTGTLIVARSQGGTTAPPVWPVGTSMIAIAHGDHYNGLLQHSEIRTISNNPNDNSLAPNFAGEKVYQDSPAGCERWWKSFNDVNPYWDIITGAACGNEAYQDIGWDYDLLKAAV